MIECSVTPFRFLAAIFAALLALACGSARAATPADTLVIARDINTIISLDPQESFEIPTGDPLNAMYLRLVQHDPRDFAKIVPAAAESWQMAPDGKRITFKIRSGLKFQSGNPLTAEDAAFSLRRGVLLNKSPSFILRQFGFTKENLDDTIKVDGDKVVLSFAKSFPEDLLLSSLSTIIASVVDKKEVMAHEQNGDLGNQWLKTHSAGAGAYRLQEWKAKDALVLEANPGYVGGAPKLKRVVIRHVAEPATQRLLLEKGDVDIAADLNADQVQALSADKNVKVARIPRGTVIYLAMNQANPTLAKPEVWQAVRWLIDYEGIANKLLHGQFQVDQSPVARGVPGALTETPYKLDPAKAKDILKKAGLANGFSASLDVMAASPYQEVAQSLQNSFAQGGIKLDLRVGDPAKVMTSYRERRTDMILFVWAPDYSDPSSTLEFFTRNVDNADTSTNKNAAWRIKWLIPELTAKAEDASHTLDSAKRMKIFADLQRTLRDDSPFVFMLQQTDTIAMRANVQDYSGGVTFDSTPYWLIEKK